MADQISDAILDAILKDDPEGRVAAETMVTTGMVMVSGEITTTTYVDIPKIVRETIEGIGYNDATYGFDSKACAVMTSIDEQSPDIAMGVNPGGAGDQGMMFGYACNETKEYMPLSIMLAHKLTKKLSEVRKSGEIDYLRPDGKAQVTIEYDEHWKPQRVHAVVLSTQHDEHVSQEQINKDIIEKVVKPVCGDYLDDNTIYHINPTGRFIIGGPPGDAGLTGRKIIVDTYGGWGGHGGGAFSGKDPSKVDRSGAYMARYIAKNLAATGIMEHVEVQLAYAIGVVEPVSVFVDGYPETKVPQDKIVQAIRDNFDLTPAGIIKTLDLKKPIYKNTAAYGHFGREEFAWEKLDKVEALKKALS